MIISESSTHQVTNIRSKKSTMGRNSLANDPSDVPVGDVATASTKKGLGCVMQALKCSSRATKEDNPIPAPLSVVSDDDHDSIFDDLPTGEEGEAVDFCGAVDHVPATVTRIPSEDTHDTHDTPPVSNVDPNRTPSHDLPPKTGETKREQLDAIVSTYFNTPAGQPQQTLAPLGDSISPVDSIEEVELPSSSSYDGAKTMLQIPEISPRIVKTKSEESSLLGEELLEEKKLGDDSTLLLHPDNASMTIGYQHTSATTKTTRTVMRPSQRGSFTSDSSFTTISSFSHLRSNSSTPLSFATSEKFLTPRPFFWRTHPSNITAITPQSGARKEEPRIPRIDTTKPKKVEMSVAERFRPKYVSPDEVSTEVNAYCTPFLQPEVVRKFLGGESQPLRLEVNSISQATVEPSPTVRSQQFVQSLTSRLPNVFGHVEETQPPNLNFAMG